MTHAQTLLETHPRATGDVTALANALHALDECAQSCILCADACLAEDSVADLRRCIGLDLDCAALCVAAAAIVGRRTDADAAVTRAALDACITACEACAAECERHAGMHEHCKMCAEACRRCADACRTFATETTR